MVNENDAASLAPPLKPTILPGATGSYAGPSTAQMIEGRREKYEIWEF